MKKIEGKNAVDWTLPILAKENNELNATYFLNDEYKKIEAYFKLKNAIEYILSCSKKNMDLLDIGCGSGWHAVYLKKEGLLNNINFYGSDISKSMCNNAKNNFPEGTFFVGDITKEHYNQKYDIIMESAVIELVHDWKQGTLNMLKSSKEWFIAHRLFFTDKDTHIQQVTTYNNLLDIRFSLGLKDFKDVLKQENFKLVFKDVWHTGSYKMGTFVARRQK